MSSADDEFAEFDTTEDELEAMMAAGTPVEVVNLPFLTPSSDSLWRVVSDAEPTFGTGDVAVASYSAATWSASSSSRVTEVSASL